jgi:hypothetical protein
MSATDHVGRSEQLRMFMTPREILEDYGPHDADRWLSVTEQPDGIGQLGPNKRLPPMLLMSRPEEFGIIPEFDDPRKDADEYAERWHATKAKYDRGEELDMGVDASYEPGDPAPGTPEQLERQGYTNPDFTDRENYLDSWSGYTGIESIKEEMAYDEFTGTVDDYIDEQKRLHYESAKSQRKYNIGDLHDPATWFENDEQVWTSALTHAKKPTEELRNAAEADAGEGQTFSLFPEGLGAYARVEGMGVEEPVVLGLDPEVNVKRDIKRPIWKGAHDVISAAMLRPDQHIPVRHTAQTTGEGGLVNAIYPRSDRMEWGRQFIEPERDRIAFESHADDPQYKLTDDAVDTFWGEEKPKPLPGPGQLSLFD